MEFSVLVRMCGNGQFKITDSFTNVVQINTHFERQCFDETIQFYHSLQHSPDRTLPLRQFEYEQFIIQYLIIEQKMVKRLV